MHPKCSLLNRATALAHRRESFFTLRQQASVRCPECGARVTVEMGVMRCTVCEWQCSIHDVS